jgi:tellurite methyltransferase
MVGDATRWDRKYATSDIPESVHPDPCLLAAQAYLPHHGAALDLASGLGHDAVHLAQLGYTVTAIDCSQVALRKALLFARQQETKIRAVVADLSRLPLPSRYFDVITIFKYLERGICASVTDALTPGGVLCFRTFNQNHLRNHPGFNPGYVLQAGELASLFGTLEWLVAQDGSDPNETTSWLVARRPPD